MIVATSEFVKKKGKVKDEASKKIVKPMEVKLRSKGSPQVCSEGQDHLREDRSSENLGFADILHILLVPPALIVLF